MTTWNKITDWINDISIRIYVWWEFHQTNLMIGGIIAFALFSLISKAFQ